MDAVVRTCIQVRIETGRKTFNMLDQDVASQADKSVEKIGPLSIPRQIIRVRVSMRDSRYISSLAGK